MAKPRYRHAHQTERARWKPIVEAGEAYCAQPICVMRTRWIAPGARWCLGHDDTGTTWIGPVHERCNAADGARRGNRMRARRARPQPPRPTSTAGRWVL